MIRGIRSDREKDPAMTDRQYEKYKELSAGADQLTEIAAAVSAIGSDGLQENIKELYQAWDGSAGAVRNVESLYENIQHTAHEIRETAENIRTSARHEMIYANGETTHMSEG